MMNRMLSVIALLALAAGCVKHSPPKPLLDTASASPGFPSFGPIRDADPAVTHNVAVRLPTRLKVDRTPGTLSISMDDQSFVESTLPVGSGMITGTHTELFVYPQGQPRPPASHSSSLGSGFSFNDTSILNTIQGGIPAPGQRYIVEVDITLFETDIPAQHFWQPESGRYKILARRTLKHLTE